VTYAKGKDKKGGGREREVGVAKDGKTEGDKVERVSLG
jgi:hypothetical protein